MAQRHLPKNGDQVVLQNLPLGDDARVLVVVLAVGEEARGELRQGEDRGPRCCSPFRRSHSGAHGANSTLVLLGPPTGLDGRELHDSLSPARRVLEHEVHLPSLLDLPCLVLPLPQSDAHFRLPSAESRPLPGATLAGPRDGCGGFPHASDPGHLSQPDRLIERLPVHAQKSAASSTVRNSGRVPAARGGAFMAAHPSALAEGPVPCVAPAWAEGSRLPSVRRCGPVSSTCGAMR